MSSDTEAPAPGWTRVKYSINDDDVVDAVAAATDEEAEEEAVAVEVEPNKPVLTRTGELAVGVELAVKGVAARVGGIANKEEGTKDDCARVG